MNKVWKINNEQITHNPVKNLRKDV